MNHTIHGRLSPFGEIEPVLSYQAAVGNTVSEIVAAAPGVPDWFWLAGEVRINGSRVPRELWGRVRPKLSRPDRPIIITLHPVYHGGGDRGSTKNIVTTVAAIALIAGATLVSGGLLGPAGLALGGAAWAAGGWAATLTAAGLSLSATALLAVAAVAPPPQDSTQQDSRQLSNAGISQNPIRPMRPLPIVLGRIRYSPPLIAPPYTTLENGIVYIHTISGLAGHYSIDTDDILLNAVAIDDFEEAEYQVRTGSPSDVPLTICNQTIIEKRGQNSLLSGFILEAKQDRTTILVHQADPDRDLPQWQLFKTAGTAEEIRIRLFWGAIQSGEIPETAFVPIRVEIRQRGTSTWLKMPVAHFRAFRLNEQIRKEIRLIFANPGGTRINHDEQQNCFAVYYTTGDGQAFEYNAESYFANTENADEIPVMTSGTTSGVTVSASSTAGSDAPWKAADSSLSTFWRSANNSLPAFLKVDFGSAKTIKSVMIRQTVGASIETFCPKDFTIEGSNDDSTWTVLGTFSGITDWVAQVNKWFQIDPGSYQYYRLVITANNGEANNAIIIGDFRLSLGDAAGGDLSAIFPSHVNTHDDGVDYFLDPATFPIGEYEVRVKRGLGGKVAVFDDDAYEYDNLATNANFFDYIDAGGSTDRYRVTIGQGTMSAETVLESFATVSSDYPFHPSIHQKGVAMIAVRVPSVTIETLSAIFHSIVPVYSAANDWSVDEPSSLPAALARHVLLSTEQNAEALPGELINEDAFQRFYAFNVAEGHEFNGVVDGQSVIEVYRQVLAAGYGAPDWPGYWSVIWEYDRSAEDPVQLFTPLDTRGLTVTRTFPRLPHALRPIFFDEDDDFNVNEASLVYVDGQSADTATRIEEMNYPGITDAAKVATRALFDLRQMYLRPTRYSFEIGLAGLACNRGDLVMLNHDVISRYHDYSRIKSIQRSGGNITGLTLESKVNLAVAVGEVEENMAAGIQFSDRTTGTYQVNEKTLTDTITFVTPFPDPDDGKTDEADFILEVGMTVGFGVVGSESKRMVVLWYEYVDEFVRRITLVDEAPGLHA